MSTEQTPLETLINNLELGKLVDHESNEFILALDFAINFNCEHHRRTGSQI